MINTSTPHQHNHQHITHQHSHQQINTPTHQHSHQHINKSTHQTSTPTGCCKSPIQFKRTWNENHGTQAEFERKRAELAAREWRATQLMTCELKIGLKRTIGPRGKPFFHQMITPPCTTPTSARKSSADRPPLAV
jgi:hypothetical protein